jgi:predicted metal-dependent hydrolase
VTLPWWGSRKGARAFVESQARWIARQRAQRAARPDRGWRAGDVVWVDGERCTLELLARAGRLHLSCGGRDVGVAASAGLDLRPAVETWLRDRALVRLRGELAALAATFGIAVTRVSIRNQRSRWGSCSRRGTISLNWRLVQVPPFVREYVLVHELMHRRELNHSARFWRHVAAACPRYVEARRWLRTEGMGLF